MTNGTYHCELGNFPARILHSASDAVTLSVAFADDRRETVIVPGASLDLVFTPKGKARAKNSTAYGKALIKTKARTDAENAADAKARKAASLG